MARPARARSAPGHMKLEGVLGETLNAASLGEQGPDFRLPGNLEAAALDETLVPEPPSIPPLMHEFSCRVLSVSG